MQKKTELTEKQKELARKAQAKIEELKDWGFENGLIIDAFMQSNIYGVFPRLSFIDMSPEQKLAYAADKKAQRMTQEFDKQDATK